MSGGIRGIGVQAQVVLKTVGASELLSGESAAALREVVNRAGEAAAEASRRLAPVRTGRLRDSIGWTAGTVMGVLMGNILPHMLVNALSVALYGMFLAVIIPASVKDRFIAAVVAVSMAASALFAYAPLLRSVSAGFRVIILTILIAGGAALIRPVNEEELS